jgi:hypothetical protein
MVGLVSFPALAQEKAEGESECGIKFDQPALISSAGQSADVKLVGMMAKRMKLEAEVKVMAKPEDLEGKKTLVIVPGFSAKGLGAAGISQKDEMERVVALVEAANKQEIPILMIHIGGNARRKGQSDSFNELVAKNSKYMIVVEQGNEDGFFSELSKETGVVLETVEKIPGTMKPMKNLFE